MTINSTRQGSTMTIVLDGRLDANTSMELEKYLDDNLDDAENLIFDFENMGYISSAGLRTVLSTRKRLEGDNSSVKIINASQNIIDIFTSTGFCEIIDIKP